MGGHGRGGGVRRDGQVEDAAELSAGQPAGGVRRPDPGDLERVLPVGVGDPGDELVGAVGRAEHTRQPVPDTGSTGKHPGRTVPVGHPVHCAADLDRAGPSGAVRCHLAEVVGRGKGVRDPGRPRSAEGDLQVLRLGVRGQLPEQPQPARALVDQPGPVAARGPRVELAVVGVPAQVRAVGPAGVHVAVPLVVGQERDPAVDPGRILQLAVDPLQKRLELAVTGPVDPEPAGGPAPVALPRGGSAAVAGHAEDHRPVGPGGHGVDRAVGQPLRDATGQRYGVRPGLAAKRPGDGRGREHPPVVGPAEHPGEVRPPVGQPPGRAAVGRHHVHLGRAVAAAGVRDQVAGRGQPGVRDRRQIGGQPIGPAAVDRAEPDVVLGGEADRVTADGREAEVRR